MAKKSQEVLVVDMLQRAVDSGVEYQVGDELLKELRLSVTPNEKSNDFDDLDGERIYCLVGPGGVGKSSCVHQLGKMLNYEVYSFNLGGTVQEELHGIPDREAAKDSVSGARIMGRLAAGFAPPFFRKPNSKSGYGIWLIDEIFSGTSLDHQLFVRMVAGRRCDEMKMFPGWYIVGTTNPPGPEHLAVQKLDVTTASRFIFFNVNSSPEAKLKYWRDKMEPLVYKFLLVSHLSKAKLGYIDACPARVWWNLAKDIGKRLKSNGGTPDIVSISKLLRTHTDSSVAAAFQSFLTYENDQSYQPLSCAEVMKDSESLKRVKIWIERDDRPMVGATLWDILAVIEEDIIPGKYKPSDEEVKNLAAFCVEIGTSGMADMVDSIFHAARNSSLAGKLVELTRKTKLRDVTLKLFKKHAEEVEAR